MSTHNGNMKTADWSEESSMSNPRNKNGGKNKETKVRHGVAHMKKGRKGKRWLR